MREMGTVSAAITDRNTERCFTDLFLNSSVSLTLFLNVQEQEIMTVAATNRWKDPQHWLSLRLGTVCMASGISLVSYIVYTQGADPPPPSRRSAGR
jgi:hypothetical protein